MDPNVFHPDDHEEIARCWGISVASGDPYNVSRGDSSGVQLLTVSETIQMEYRVRAADGSWRWHLAKARKITGDDGKIESWIGSLTDV